MAALESLCKAWSSWAPPSTRGSYTWQRTRWSTVTPAQSIRSPGSPWLTGRDTVASSLARWNVTACLPMVQRRTSTSGCSHLVIPHRSMYVRLARGLQMLYRGQCRAARRSEDLTVYSVNQQKTLLESMFLMVQSFCIRNFSAWASASSLIQRSEMFG